jgi:hypothetical protein
MFKKSVTSIMADFSKKIDALEKLKVQKNKDIQIRNNIISVAKNMNYEDQAEISLADRVINSLNGILK